MVMFEMGGLKEQKLNLKNLVSRPEFKQQYLAPLRAMPEEDMCHLAESSAKGDNIDSSQRSFKKGEADQYSEDFVFPPDQHGIMG